MIRLFEAKGQLRLHFVADLTNALLNWCVSLRKIKEKNKIYVIVEWQNLMRNFFYSLPLKISLYVLGFQFGWWSDVKVQALSLLQLMKLIILLRVFH